MEFKVLMDKEKKTWASLGRLEIDLTNYSMPGSLQTWELQLQGGDTALSKRLPKTVCLAIFKLQFRMVCMHGNRRRLVL
jgi:hypothetical protein